MARRKQSAPTTTGGAFLVLFGVVWLAMSSAMLLAGGGLRAFTDDSLVRVDGSVVELLPSAMSDGGTGCRAVIGYAAPDGSDRTVTAPTTESPCRRLGEPTTVYVDPADPSVAIVDPLSGVGGWLLPVFLLIGVLVLLQGVVTMVRGVTRARRESGPAAGPPLAPATSAPDGGFPPGLDPTPYPGTGPSPDPTPYPGPHRDADPGPASGAQVAPPLF